MKTLHTCKHIVIRAVILGMFFSSPGPLFCAEQEKQIHEYSANQVEIADVADNTGIIDQIELTQAQLNKMQKMLASLGIRAAREDAPSYLGSKPNQVVSSSQEAVLRAIQECLCEIKRCLEELKEASDISVLSKVCEIDMNVGDQDDTISIPPEEILDVNVTTTLSVIQWLKVIYNKLK